MKRENYSPGLAGARRARRSGTSWHSFASRVCTLVKIQMRTALSLLLFSPCSSKDKVLPDAMVRPIGLREACYRFFLSITSFERTSDAC